MLKGPAFCSQQVVETIFLIHLRAFCVATFDCLPQLLRFRQWFPSFNINFKLPYRALRIPNISSPPRALDIRLSIIIDEQTGIDALKGEEDWIAPFVRPDVCRGHMEVIRIEVCPIASGIGADHIKNPFAISN